MSPSSSTVPPSNTSIRSQAHSRKPSTTAIPQQAPTASRPAKPSPASTEPLSDIRPHKKHSVNYRVFIRLPFPRITFEDPPPVDWNATKDRQLWKLISSASNSRDLDWEAMSGRFEVPLAFLLQQAAWLYERHFEGMRAQMKRLGAGAGSGAGAGAGVSGAPSPRLPEVQHMGEGSTVGGVGMQRKGSNDPKFPPSINTQRSLQAGGAETGSSPATPRSSKPLLSRNPSTNTVTQSRVQGTGTSPRQSSLRAFRGSSGSQRRPPPPVQNVESSQEGDNESALGHDGASDETESEGEEQQSALARSKITRRPQLGKRPTLAGADSDGDAEDDDEESSGDGYLPFAAAASSKPLSRDDPAATLRGSPKRQTATLHTGTSSKTKSSKPPPPESSESSASSAQPPPSSSASASNNPAAGTSAEANAHRGPLSPKQRAQLEKLSPRYKSGSDGTPSMGSSFSDLDDLSVTQSALEEALMSNMQHGTGSLGMGSRMSNLRDALGRK